MTPEEKIKWAEIVRINHDVPAIQAAAKELIRLREALEEISKGRGAFSLDPLEHAGNVIEESKRIAIAALRGGGE